jgi:toxin YoeB
MMLGRIIYTGKQKIKRPSGVSMLSIRDIQRNSYTGIGKPEPLRGNFSGYWSRRIDAKNRLVYRIVDDLVEIHEVRSHYE